MYRTETVDIDKVVRQAQDVIIKNDRVIFLPLLRQVSKFAQENGIMVAGRSGAEALLGNNGIPQSSFQDMWTMELIANDIDEVMQECIENIATELERGLADGTYNESYDLRTLMLITLDNDAEYEIKFLGRRVVYGRSLGEYKEQNILAIVDTKMDVGPFLGAPIAANNPSKLMGPHTQIMFCLKALCDPLLVAEWADNYLPLLARLMKFIRDSDVEKQGAHEEREASEASIEGDASFAEADMILIGEQAVAKYMGAPDDNKRRPQFLCSFAGLMDYAQKHGYSCVPSDVRAPDDFRLRKRTLRKLDSGDMFADLFNPLEYSVIGYHDKSARYDPEHKIAAPFVVLRFLFVDIWSLSFLIQRADNTEGGSSQGFRKRQRSLLRLAIRFFEWIMSKTEDIVFPRNYAGNFILERTAKAALKKRAKRNIFVPPRPVVAIEDIIELKEEVGKKINHR